MGKVVEFTGMPAAGKSTQIELLVEALSARGESVTVVGDRDVDIHDVPPSDFCEFNRRMYFNLLDRYRAWEASPTDWLLLDRGFHDRPVWPRSDLAAGYCDEAQARRLIAMSRENDPRPPDRVIMLLVSPEVSLRRRTEPITDIDRFIVNEKYLSVLRRTYDERRAELPSDVLWIDGEVPIRDVHARILEHIDARS